MIRHAVAALDRFFFAPLDHHVLGIMRIVLVGFFALPRLPRGLAALEWARWMPVEWMEPAFGVRLALLPYPMPGEWIGWFGLVMRVAGTCALLGIATRPAMIVFAIGFLYLAGGQSSWGFFGHTAALPAEVLLILAFAPGADAWSLDRLWKWLRAGRRPPLWRALNGPPVSGWGLKLILLVVSLVYLCAGVSKLRYGGLEWANGETLAFYMQGRSRSVVQQYGGPGQPAPEQAWKDGYGLEFQLYATGGSALSRQLAEHRVATAGLSMATLLTELGFPLVLLGGLWRAGFLLAGAAFHGSSAYLLGTDFRPYLWLCLLLLDWPAIGAAATRLLQRAPAR